MKKKIVGCVLIIAVFFAFPLMAFAQGRGSTEINVTAKYIGKTSYTSDFHGGRAEIKVKGAVFSFTGDIADGTEIAVIPVTEEDAQALKWIQSVLKGEENLLPYYIALFRNGEEIPVSSALRVEISFDDSKFKPTKLLYVDDSGRKTEIRFTQTNKTISFNLQDAGYFVFVSSSADTGNVPKTGESADWIWIAWILASISLMLLFATIFSHMTMSRNNVSVCKKSH